MQDYYCAFVILFLLLCCSSTAASYKMTTPPYSSKPTTNDNTNNNIIINNNNNNMMKAIVYGGANTPLQTAMRKIPQPGKRGRILVQVHAVGLNPVDAKNVIGDKVPHDWHRTHKFLDTHVTKHKIVGFDFAGVVAETNHGFQKGDRVFGSMPPLEGTLAEYVSVPLDQVCYAPQNVPLTQAAAMPLVGLTALQCLSPHLTSSSTSSSNSKSVLVIGASGGTGHVAVQVARNLGARHVTAVCSGRNADFVTQCGATHVVDYTLDDGNLDTLHHNLQQSPGWPFDVVMDCVTSADPRDSRVDYPSLIRRYHLDNANNNNNNRQSLVTEDHIYRRLGGKSPDWLRAGVERLCGGLSLWPDRHEKLFWIRFPHSSHELRQLQEWAEADQLTIQLSNTVPFTAEAVQEAFDQILDRRVQGKLVVQVVDNDSANDNAQTTSNNQ